MKNTYRIVLYDQRNGNAKDVIYTTDILDDKGIVYYWTDGNMACDCNRSLIMYENDELDCDTYHIRLVHIWNDTTGEHLYYDGVGEPNDAVWI